MLTKSVIKHFGSRAKVAQALGYSRQAIYRWGDTVPLPAQYRIQVATAGRFKVKSERVTG
jgi:hypothetical protein